MIHHGWPTTKNTPKKQNLDQKIKILKIKFKNLRPGRLLNVLCTFNLRLVSTGQVQIFCQKNSNPIKTSKIIHSTIQFRSKNVTHFKNLESLKSIKNILPQHSQKHVSGWCQKKKLHCTISRQKEKVHMAVSTYHVISKRVHITVHITDSLRTLGSKIV